MMEMSHHSLITNLVKELRNSKLYSDLQDAAEEEILKPSVRVSDLQKAVQSGLIKSGWDKELKNVVYNAMQKQNSVMSSDIPPDLEAQKEPLAHLRKAQMNWEKRILKSLNSMCTELSVPLAKKRSEKDRKDLASRWSELGTTPPDLSQIRPVYAPKDFLEVIANLQNNNYNNNQDIVRAGTLWGIIQIPLKVKSIHELRLQYSEMSINQCQTGVDDAQDIPPELFDLDRTKLGKKVVINKHSPLSQEFSKKGCPVSLRAVLWRQMLGVEVTDVDQLYYEQLKAYVMHHDLLVDNLLYKDVKLTATNDDHYFVFEDFLYQVLLPFSRDTKVLEHFARNSATPAKSYIRGKLGMQEYAVIYPPNGVIPFHGFAMYVAPLCYLYDDIVTLYHVFREFYCRYFFRLHSISSHPQGIVSLCRLFEDLLQGSEPMLSYHLVSIGCQPLKIAFKWLVRAFSGYLSSDQVLLLWDRLLAYNSLEILPVLAVAIFSFRKTNLVKVQTVSAAEAVLADLTTLQVIPLIQLMLFSK
ncbi:TBC1 domain family member 19-like [Liolophura sinensis]|uniref:TBC1 domain family member 19-like n=1 Tax=Liolophura sinensis TaxID=3198878 RepID=UPI003158E8A5